MEMKITYNRLINAQIRKLGEMKSGYVEIHPELEAEAKELQKKIDDTVLVQIVAKEDIRQWRNSIDYCGYVIAKASGRDSGAFVPPSVSQISGKKPTSGGSMKNWVTIIPAGSVFRLRVARFLIADEDGGFELVKQPENVVSLAGVV